MLSRTPTLLGQPVAGTAAVKSPALVTSVRVRAASTQTDRTPIKMLHHQLQQQQQSTQTDSYENDHHKLTASGGRPLPRVVDASPKPKLTKLADLTTTTTTAGRGSGSWAVDEEERPSVERRSYTASRIPTPIKPTSVTPTTTTIPASSSSNNNNHHLSHKMSSSPMTPSKRELPDLPVSKVSSASKQHVLLTPQLGRQQHPHRNGNGLYVASKSEPAKVLTSSSSSSEQLHQLQQNTTTTTRPVKSSIWGSWWRL